MTDPNPFEDRLIGDIERGRLEKKRNEALEKAYVRAQKLIERDAIDPERDFGDLYDSKQIQADKEYVERREKQIRKEQETETPAERRAQQHATILEALVHEQIRASGWLGRGVRAVKTSRFDDIKNGVDEIIEFLDDGDAVTSRLALAVDVTFSNQLASKFQRIREEIDSGELAEVKYFASDASHQRGELTHLPRVVIGAEILNVKKLIDVWIQDSETKELVGV